MKAHRWLLPLAGFAMLAACASEPEGSGDVQNLTQGEGKLLVPVKPTCTIDEELKYTEEAQDGEELGETRRRSIEEYAAKLMANESCRVGNILYDKGIAGVADFTARQEHDTANKQPYRIVVGNEDGKKCFENALGNDRLENDWYHDRLVGMLPHVSRFVGYFHEAYNGQMAHTFRTFRICDQDIVGKNLKLNIQSDTLEIGVQLGGLDELVTWPEDVGEIKETWASGEQVYHLAGINSWFKELALSLKGSPQEKAWALIDPIGNARVTLRKELAAVRGRIESEQITNPFASNVDSQMKSFINNLGSSAAESGDKKKQGLAKCARNWLDGANKEQIVEVATSVRNYAADPSHWNGISNAVSAATQPKPNAVKATIVQNCGLFAFGNLKVIDVDLNVGGQLSANDLKTYGGDLSEAEVKSDDGVKVEQSAFICLYLIDQVDVSVNIQMSVSSYLTLESHVLRRALLDSDVSCATGEE